MKVYYFNNAATSWPKAPGTAEAVADAIRGIPFHAARSGFDYSDNKPDSRTLLAGYMKISDASRIVNCANATHALNIALHGFRWSRNSSVVTSAAEHNSVLRPLHYLAMNSNVKTEIIPVDISGRVITDEFERAVIKLSPQMVVLAHASNVTGCINNVSELAGIARKHGAVVLLDASQTMGITDVTPELWGVDLVAFTGHKYLLGPAGTGGLYISEDIELNPVWVGGTGIHSDMDEMPAEMPVRFEAGTPNDSSFAGLAAALKWQKDNPVEPDVLNRKIEHLSDGLIEAGAITVKVSAPRTPVVSFNIPGLESEEAGEILFKSFDIVCRTGLHCAPLIHRFLDTGPSGNIRFSISRFTTDDEIDYAISAVRSILE